MMFKSLKSIVKWHLPFLAMFGVWIYCIMQEINYEIMRHNHQANTMTIQANVINESLNVFDNYSRYTVCLKYYNPFIGKMETQMVTQYCINTRPTINYCHARMSNLSNSTLVHITESKMKDQLPSIDILMNKDIFELPKMNWWYWKMTIGILFMMVYIPMIMCNKYRDIRQNVLLIIIWWFICTITIVCVHTKYYTNHQRWRYIKTDLPIMFIVKTNVTQNVNGYEKVLP